MKTIQKISATAVLSLSGLMMLAGCCNWPEKTPTPPLGTQSDAIWRRQAVSASASDFVIYQSEFVSDTAEVKLNPAGEDHLKAIAARLHCGAPMPVVVERSNTSVNPDTTYKYPVNPNPQLDMVRRDYIIKALVSLGIANADQCVVVAPAFAEGYSATESAAAYDNGMNNVGRGFGGFGAGHRGGLAGIGVGGTIQ